MEEMSSGQSSRKQNELIQRYCEEAASLLATAQDYASAVRLRTVLCERFRIECDSTLVVSATTQYIDDLLKKRWEKEGRDFDSPIDKR